MALSEKGLKTAKDKMKRDEFIKKFKELNPGVPKLPKQPKPMPPMPDFDDLFPKRKNQNLKECHYQLIQT